MKTLLNEIVNIAYKDEVTKQGKPYILAYIDPKTSDPTFKDGKPTPLKDFAQQCGAQWRKGVWCWYLWNGEKDPQINNIRAFVNGLNKVETPPIGSDKPREIEDILLTLGKLEASIRASKGIVETSQEEQIKNKLEYYKTEFFNSLKDTEKASRVLEMMAQIRFENMRYMNRPLSLLNTITILFIKPDATHVRAKGTWEKIGYKIKEGATAIPLCGPLMARMPYKSEAEKNLVRKKFLEDNGLESLDEMSPLQALALEDKLKGKEKFTGKFFYYIGYDASDVEINPNAEKVQDFPDMKYPKLSYYTDTSLPSDFTMMLAKCTQEFGESLGLTFNYVPEGALDGANGSAMYKDGVIKVADKVKNAGFVKTMVHEMAHQLMHIDWLSKKDDFYSKYYNGEQDREVREQQADLCAWFVLRQFGIQYDATSVYVQGWGLNDNNFSTVFDSIVKVSNYIYNGILKKGGKELEALRHSLGTGEELAKEVGMEGEYNQSKQEVNIVNGQPQPSGREFKQINEQKEMFWSFYNRMNIL